MKPLNLVALLLALATLDKPKGERTHRHRCTCGNEWEHADTCAGDENAHKCIKCGEIVWTRVWT